MAKILIIFTLLFLFFSQTIVAEPLSREETVLMNKLLEQTGQSAETVAMQMATMSANQMAMSLKVMFPDAEQRIIDLVKKAVMELVYEELIVKKVYAKMIYPIYFKYYTQDDIKQIIEINSTPLGKKMIKTMPLIMQEALQAGQEYSKILEPMLIQKLTEMLEREGMQ
jgi:uncharacterized protein